MSITVVQAPAKLTLSLRVTGRRPDGFHLIEAEMVTVDLRDRLELSAGSGLVVLDAVDWSGVGDVPGLGSAKLKRDLVEVALEAVGRTAAVRLTKHIPAAAGLGGGSSDAAAVLRWTGCFDPAVAVAVGADVPFCLHGGRAIVRGIGEVVEPIAHRDDAYL